MRTGLGLLLTFGLAGGALAEDAVLFKASSLPTNAWGTEKAVLAKRDTSIIIREASSEIKRVGAVYPKPLLPFFRRGRVVASVRRLRGGAYSLHLLCFRKGVHTDTVILAADVATSGTRVFSMDQCKVPDGTESFLLKLWIAGWVGAEVELEDLSYVVPWPDAGVELDDVFRGVEGWESDNVNLAWQAGGAQVALQPAKTGGALVCPELLGRNDDAVMLLHLDKLRGGSVSVQCIFFDGAGQGLSSTNLMTRIGEGWHAARLGDLSWPESGSHYKIKMWLAGDPGARAVFKRLMVATPE